MSEATTTNAHIPSGTVDDGEGGWYIGPVVTVDDRDLPTTTRDIHDDASDCEARHPVAGLVCTRREFHKGQHLATGPAHVVYARWGSPA